MLIEMEPDKPAEILQPQEWGPALAIVRAAANINMAPQGSEEFRLAWVRLGELLKEAQREPSAGVLARVAKGEPLERPVTALEEHLAAGIRAGLARVAGLPAANGMGYAWSGDEIESEIPGVLAALMADLMKPVPDDACVTCLGRGRELRAYDDGHYHNYPCRKCGRSEKAHPKGGGLVMDLRDQAASEAASAFEKTRQSALLRKAQAELAGQLVCSACKNANWAWYGPMDSGELRPCHACNPDGARARQAMIGGVDESATPIAAAEWPSGQLRWTGNNLDEALKFIECFKAAGVVIGHAIDPPKDGSRLRVQAKNGGWVTVHPGQFMWVAGGILYSGYRQPPARRDTPVGPKTDTRKPDYCVRWTGENFPDIHRMIYDPEMPRVAMSHGRLDDLTTVMVKVMEGTDIMTLDLPVGHWLAWDRGMLRVFDKAPDGYNTGG